MFDEMFADGDSFIHRLDPRVKLVVALAFSALTAIESRFLALGTAVVLALFLTALARLPARALAYRIAAVNGFLLFLWVTLPLTYGGADIVCVGPLNLSREGISYALLVTLKSNAIVFACIALLSTTHLSALGRALGWLHVPDKITHMLLFMLRYLGMINRDYVRLWTSMKARCFRPGTNLHTYRSYANMVGMLLITSYESAEAIYAAMMCRGFRGRFHTTEEFSFNARDFFFGAAMTALLAIMGVLQWA
jgi:cobalt/nickel transport system permease protein